METKIESNNNNSSKTENSQKMELENLIAYAQLIHYTLQHSATEINPKTIKAEVTMFYKKFGNKEVRRLANSMAKENKQKW